MKNYIVKFFLKNTSVSILIGIMIVATILNPLFISPLNLFNVFNQNAIKGIMAIGMTLVILNGYFDMSLCTLVSLSAAVCAVVGNNYGIATGIIASVLVGVIVGVINGLLIAYVKINAFVVTLAMMLGCRGLTYIIPSENSVEILNETFCRFGSGKIGPLTYISLIFIAGLVIVHIVLRYTRHGRNTYAAGGNANAASNAGIDVPLTTFINFLVCAILSAVGGVFYAAQLWTSSPSLGWPDMHMLVIAGIVLGGSKLSGGYGNIWYSLVGVMILGVVNNIMNLTNASPWISTFSTGLIMILVLIVDKFLSNLRNSVSQTI